MLIKKETTRYGYKSRIRFDVKAPALYVIKKKQVVKFEGESIITVVSGKVSMQKQDLTTGASVFDNLEDKQSYKVPKDVVAHLLAIEDTVVLEDNETACNMESYLNLTVVEDEPSSDDLRYIDEDD